MRFSVEAWAPEYGSPADDAAFGVDEKPVDVNVEVRADDWSPQHPDPSVRPPSSILFIDGVMRVEARVWVDDGAGGEHRGLCGSYGAGAVRCDGEARILEVDVQRGLFTAAPDAEPIETRSGTFEVRGTAADERDATQGLNQRMRELEREMARELVDEADLVVADGPLTDLQAGPVTVGYVKTHHTSYLPPVVRDVVGRLEAGERTPLFLATTRWSRYSWYLRLPGPRAHSWSGVVRCEASADLEPRQAVDLADTVTLALPRFASTPHKDPRAPQNLFPIAGLERELHRRLGDAHLVWRDLHRAAHSTTGAS